MSVLTDRLDHFVRWFFDSSPATTTFDSDETGPAARAEREKQRAADNPTPPHRRQPVRRTGSQHQERATA